MRICREYDNDYCEYLIPESDIAVLHSAAPLANMTYQVHLQVVSSILNGLCVALQGFIRKLTRSTPVVGVGVVGGVQVGDAIEVAHRWAMMSGLAPMGIISTTRAATQHGQQSMVLAMCDVKRLHTGFSGHACGPGGFRQLGTKKCAAVLQQCAARRCVVG